MFTAVDSTGTTSVDQLDIKIGETSIKTAGAEQPKKGDMLVVEHTIVEASGNVPAKKEYAAYIYASNGGEYVASGWQACDGNVDASKVILTSNITLAGNYTSVGNITKAQTGTGTFETQGKSVAEALQEIFTKKLQPTIT